MVVRLWVEGGGDRDALRRVCAMGFRKYVERIVPNSRRMPQIIPCGGRQEAYDNFCKALKKPDPNIFDVLLVDAEDLVEPRHAVTPWGHLFKRDRWAQPKGAVDDQAQLMVVTVEAWLVADPEALASRYKKGFREKALPTASDLEQVPKADLYKALEAATKDTTSGPYGKSDAFHLLGVIDPARVEARCKRLAPRLHAFIRANCG